MNARIAAIILVALAAIATWFVRSDLRAPTSTYQPQTLVSSPNAVILPRTLFSNGFDGLPRCAVEFTLVKFTLWGVPFTTNAQLWENLYGRTGEGQPILPWPGAGTAQPILPNLAPSQCLTAGFWVPSSISIHQTGFYEHGNNPFGPALDASISTQPGDFTDSLGSGCLRTEWPADLSAGLNYRVDALNPSQCHLQPGGRYYFNVRPSNPLDPNCCVIYLKHSRTQP